MWRPTEIGDIFAERVFTFRQGRRSRPLRLTIGRPVKGPEAADPWWCPIQLGTPFDKFTAIAGQDSLQSLILALKIVQSTLPSFARSKGGTAEWLGEYERLIFAETHSVMLQWESLARMIDGLASAVKQLEKQKPVPRALLKRLRMLVASKGASRKGPL
jgi:hypothetical protein